MPEQKISLLPLTEEERHSLLFTVTLVLSSLAIVPPTSQLTSVAMQDQERILKNIKQKLET